MDPMLLALLASGVLGASKSSEQQKQYQQQQGIEALKTQWAPFTHNPGQTLQRPSQIDPLMQALLTGAVVGQQLTPSKPEDTKQNNDSAGDSASEQLAGQDAQSAGGTGDTAAADTASMLALTGANPSPYQQPTPGAAVRAPGAQAPALATTSSSGNYPAPAGSASPAPGGINPYQLALISLMAPRGASA